MIDIYSDNGHIKGSIELVGDTAFIGNLQHGNFPCANPKISGPYPVACNHLLSITWTIKGQYRTYGNSMEACSRIHNEPPLIPSRCAQQQVLAAGGVLAGKTPSIDSAFGAESPQAGQRPRLSAAHNVGWRHCSNYQPMAVLSNSSKWVTINTCPSFGKNRVRASGIASART
jgi:hypothetical protein